MTKTTLGALAFASMIASRDARASCAKDTDCKGDRVCSAGACVSPGASESGAVAPTSSVSKSESSGGSANGTWYGWQILAMDGASILITSIGGGLWTNPTTEGPGLITTIVGWTGYAIAAPIDHFLHGNILGGLGSLAGHLGLVGLEIVILKTTADQNFDNPGIPSALGPVVIGIGMVAASVLDAILNAHDKRPAKPSTATLVPWAAPVRGTEGFAAGLAGVF